MKNISHGAVMAWRIAAHEADDLLCTFCASDEEAVARSKEIFLSAVKFSESPPAKRRMIIEVIE